jgi:hypothetical protein
MVGRGRFGAQVTPHGFSKFLLSDEREVGADAPRRRRAMNRFTAGVPA